MRIVVHPGKIRSWVLEKRFEKEPEALAAELGDRITVVDRKMAPYLPLLARSPFTGDFLGGAEAKRLARATAYGAIGAYWLDHAFRGRRYYFPRIITSVSSAPWMKPIVSDVIHILDLDSEQLLTGLRGSRIEQDLQSYLRESVHTASSTRPTEQLPVGALPDPFLVRRVIDAIRVDPINAWLNPFHMGVARQLVLGVLYAPTKAARREAKAQHTEVLTALSQKRSQHLARDAERLFRYRAEYEEASQGTAGTSTTRHQAALARAAKRLGIRSRSLENDLQLADKLDNISQTWSDFIDFLENQPADHPLKVLMPQPGVPAEEVE